MKIFKVTTPVSVMSRRFMRSFDRDEIVTETERDLLLAQFLACFEERKPEQPASKG